MADLDSDTTAVDHRYLRTVTVHDRQFQQYAVEHSIYFGPVDEEESERLHIQHQVFQRVFDGRLIFPPIQTPEKILECGYGAGSWAVDVAEQYPDCEVIGIDISPHMRPDDPPDNLWLQVDDLNRAFTFRSNTFDVVHSSLVASGIARNRWGTYLRDIVRVLKPNGWLQMVEAYYNCQSDSGLLTENHALRQWSSNLFSALNSIKDLRAPLRLSNMMTSAGLVDVEARMIPLPLCDWSRDPREREIGLLNRDNINRLLASFAIYPFTQRLGMSREQLEELVQRAQAEANDLRLKAYFPLYVCIGRKPARR